MTTATARTPSAPREVPYLITLGALVLVVVAVTFARLPHGLGFSQFAFNEPGANLTAQYLTDRGLRPVLDLGYPYGALTLLAGRVWFGVFGLTPRALAAAWIVCALLQAWGLARVARAMRLGPAGVTLLVAAAPLALRVFMPNLTHGIEAALMSHALAEQARSRYGRALVLATACCFTKPSMGYPYGLILLIFATWDHRRALLGRGYWAGVILPPALAALALAGWVVWAYGAEALFRTILPLSSMKTYKHFNYGFFGAGRDFWRPPGATLRYYLGTAAGFWIAGSVVLLAAAAVALVRMAVRRHWGKVHEILVTCALVHVVFVATMFGNAWSWFYYFYFLVIGLATATHLGRFWRVLACALALMAVVGLWSDARGMYGQWRESSPQAELGGLWAPADVAEEWSKVLELTRGRSRVALNRAGAAPLLFPGFSPPAGAYFDFGYPSAEELRRQSDLIAAAETVVVPKDGTNPNFFTTWPEFQAHMGDFSLLWEGRHFWVYFRKPEGQAGPPSAPATGRDPASSGPIE
ncbi:MAG: hypothetical protein U0835_09175 [Isosphaeraceae bacterium]